MSIDAPLIGTLAIIGLGLIGSSICRKAREDRLVRNIIGYDNNAETRAIAAEINLVDQVIDDPSALNSADLIILCVPVGVMGAVCAQIAPHLKPGCILSDTGSTKESVIQQCAPYIPDSIHFVPAHPIAGTENSGPRAGFSELFKNRWCLLTPLPHTDPEALKAVKDFWICLGSITETMAPDHHDRVLAMTSHLPHLIAYTTVGIADNLEEITENEIIKYSASGFRDFTRLAASDPIMWRDIFLHNRNATLEMLGHFTEELVALQRAIRRGDGETLLDYFSHTRDIRRQIIDAGQDVDLDDFGRQIVQSHKIKPRARCTSRLKVRD